MTKADKERISEVVWEDPAPEIRDRYDWDKIALQLRARPGVWAKVFDRDRVSVANAVRQGSVGVVSPALGFEYKTRNNVRGVGPDRTCTLFIRWVAPKEVE